MYYFHVGVFSYPVVPKGKAGVRTQFCAGHIKEDIAYIVDAFKETRTEIGNKQSKQLFIDIANSYPQLLSPLNDNSYFMSTVGISAERSDAGYLLY